MITAELGRTVLNKLVACSAGKARATSPGDQWSMGAARRTDRLAPGRRSPKRWRRLCKYPAEKRVRCRYLRRGETAVEFHENPEDAIMGKKSSNVPHSSWERDAYFSSATLPWVALGMCAITFLNGIDSCAPVRRPANARRLRIEKHPYRDPRKAIPQPSVWTSVAPPCPESGKEKQMSVGTLQFIASN